jgi:outer membrane protein assembly factor BamB
VPVVSRGKLFVHARVKGKDQEEVVALDAKTGKDLWRDSYDRAPYKSMFGAGPRGTPTVVGNRLYTFGITGVLGCYQVDNGKRLWQVDVYKKLSRSLPNYGVCCSPLVLGNRVLVSIGGEGTCVVAFDTEKGEVQWKGFDEPASTASPILFLGGGKKRGALPDVVFMTTLRLLAVNPLDGTLNWEFPLSFRPAGASATPIVQSDRIVTTTIDNGAVAVRVSREGDAPAAARAWQNKELTGYFSTGVAVGDDVYLITNVTKPLPTATLRCIDGKTGKERWNKPDVGFFHAGLVRTANNRLLMLDDAGRLKLLEANPKEYRELASAKVCDGTFVNPVVCDGLLYARDGKQLLCVKLNE